MPARHAIPSFIPASRAPASARGFTLIEVMIVVAIIGILVAVAFPSYVEYGNRTRRSDAQLSLLTISQAMERCRSTRFTYANCAIPAISPEGHYDLALTVQTDNTFTATATPVADGIQENDSDCQTITLDHLGTQGPLAPGDLPSECWD